MISETPLHALVAPMDLEPIKARCDAATYGPGRLHERQNDNGDEDYWVDFNDRDDSSMMQRQDADFIAHARMDVPNLVREVERLRKELAALLLTAGPQETPKVTPTNQVLTTLMILREQGYLGVDVAEALKLAGLAKQEHRQVHVICPQCGTPFETEVRL